MTAKFQILIQEYRMENSGKFGADTYAAGEKKKIVSLFPEVHYGRVIS